MAMHKNEDAVRESDLLGREALQPETMSHYGKGMTDLGDESHAWAPLCLAEPEINLLQDIAL